MHVFFDNNKPSIVLLTDVPPRRGKPAHYQAHFFMMTAVTSIAIPVSYSHPH